MHKEDAIERKYDEIERIVNELFKSLVAFHKINKDLFISLFFDRDDESRTIINYIESDIRHKCGRNILVIGAVGIGKSSFARRLLIDIRDGQLDCFPILLDIDDYTVAHSNSFNLQGCLNSFINQFAAYFDKIGSAVPELRSTITDPYIRISILTKKLCTYEMIHANTKPAIIIDDLDYAPQHWYHVIGALKPIIRSQLATVIMLMRPGLYRSIFSYKENNLQRIFKETNTKVIYLSTLSVTLILAVKLSILLVEETKLKGHLQRFWRYAIYGRASVEEYLKDHHFDLSVIDKIDLPFSDAVLHFMQHITNGNIRDVTAIAKEIFLKLILRKGYYDVPLKELLKLFDPEKQSLYKIINIHEHISQSRTPSKDGNSVHQNVLEAFCIQSKVDPSFYKMLEEYGHSNDDINMSITQLRSWEMIEPKLSKDNIISPTEERIIEDYEICPKGLYYINYLIFEKDYIDYFKIKSKHSIFSKYSSTLLIRDARIDLLEMMWMITKYLDTIAGDLTLSLNFIERHFKNIFYLEYIETHPYREPYTLDTTKIKMLFEQMKIISKKPSTFKDNDDDISINLARVNELVATTDVGFSDEDYKAREPYYTEFLLVSQKIYEEQKTEGKND